MRSQHEYRASYDHAVGPDFPDLASWIVERVCRKDFSQPGFVLLKLPAVKDSFQLRELMVALKQNLSEIHQGNTGKRLVYMSLGRFDQQETTKPHRDGGPDESLLLLGYEPTSVRSRLSIIDDLRCAFDLGVEPGQLPPPFDPMLSQVEPLLSDHTTVVEGFDPEGYQVLLVNNSCLPYREVETALLGVMHHAVIEKPSASAQRIVNSIMLASVDRSEAEPISPDDQQRFLTTNEISKGVYE